MSLLNDVAETMLLNWPVWAVTFLLVLAAVIDGFELRVPNWLTYPMVIGGWIVSALAPSLPGFVWCEGLTWYQSLGYSLLGTLVGLALLLPAYAIGGMGAGDVKLLAGVGAWMHGWTTLYAFAISAIVGGVIALVMVLWKRAARRHTAQAGQILREIVEIRDPAKLAEIAAARKKDMFLLPYGIPLAIGSILYFAFTGLLTR